MAVDDVVWSQYEELLDRQKRAAHDANNGAQPEWTCTSFYKTMNCGSDEMGTKIGNPYSSKTPRMVRTQSKCDRAADTKRSIVKSQMMREDLNRLEQLLRTKSPSLGDVHITECRRVYSVIAQCMEKLKMKRNKTKVEIASTYYALKQFFNPTPKEIEDVFSTTHSVFLASIKQIRHIAHNCPDELGWIFEAERGQTNMFRYASKMGLDFPTIRKLQSFAEEKNLNLRDESTVMHLLKRMKAIC